MSVYSLGKSLDTIEWFIIIDYRTIPLYDVLYTDNGVRAGIASLFQYCIGAVSALLYYRNFTKLLYPSKTFIPSNI